MNWRRNERGKNTMKNFEKYIERDDLKDATHLSVSVYYNKGGANYLTGRTSPRGYYISVKPVTKNGISISYMLFSGRGQLLLEASRYSDKQFDKAVLMSQDVEEKLIASVLAECKAS